MKVRVVLLGALLVACSAEQQTPGSAPTSPTTAATTAAGPTPPTLTYDYAHRSVRTTEVRAPRGTVTLHEPADPAPRDAPVVVLTQGTGAESYQAWIDHMVKRGNIVVFQDQDLAGSGDAERFAGPIGGVRAAVAELRKPGHVTPRWRETILAGHSIGSIMSARIAAAAGQAGLPAPAAILAIQPPVVDPADARPMRGVPASTRLVVLTSDRDDRVGTEGGAALTRALGHVTKRTSVFVRSDEHGEPALIADHLFPLSGTGQEPDALDHLRLWPLVDGLRSGRLTLPDGSWSDGTAVAAATVR